MKLKGALRKIHKYQLNPRVKLIVERHPGILSSSVGLFVGCGSRHEPLALHGATHLAEHLFFKGTSRHSAEEISQILEQFGGDLNAFTDREYTCFHASVPADKTAVALDLLTEMLFDSSFEEKEFDREKSVVVQELRGYEDSPDEEFGDSMLEVPWPRHPLGRRIGGFAKYVRGFTRQRVLNYISGTFLRAPIVITVVSRANPETVRDQVLESLKLAEKSYRFGKTLKAKGRRLPHVAPKLSGDPSARTALRAFTADQVQVGFMFPAVSVKHADEVLWSAAVTLLGSSSSSRLFREVREKRGLAYSVYAAFNGFSDGGIVGGYIATDKKRFLESVSVAGEVCRNFADSLNQDDADFVRTMLEGSIVMSYDSPGHRMDVLGRQELLLGGTVTLRQTLNELKKINVEGLRRIARNFAQTPCLYALGPVSNREKGALIRAWKGGKTK